MRIFQAGAVGHGPGPKSTKTKIYILVSLFGCDLLGSPWGNFAITVPAACKAISYFMLGSRGLPGTGADDHVPLTIEDFGPVPARIRRFQFSLKRSWDLI